MCRSQPATNTHFNVNTKAVVERVAKALKAKFIDELSFKSTHVVVKNGMQAFQRLILSVQVTSIVN